MAEIELYDDLVWVESKITFYGVLEEYYDELFRRCSDATRSQYNSSYNRHILPPLSGRPLEDCELEDFEAIIETIENEKKDSLSTIQHYRYLIRTVVKCAVDKKLCSKDALFGSIFSLSPSAQVDGEKTKEFVRLRKSLTTKEEFLVCQRLLDSPFQSGQNMGLAIMFALGLRNNEACGLNFGAIRPMESHPECNCLWIYASTSGETNAVKSGGKTWNAPRILPLPDRLYQMLTERKAYLEEKINAGEIWMDYDNGQYTVDDLPIVCQGENYTKRCSSRHLTAAGRQLLREIQVNEDEVAYIDRELQNPNHEIEMGIVEKDPTAYLLRRNLGTHLYILGLSESEIQYFMGHEIEDPYVNRNDFTNEERLYLIKRKMDNRPLLNDAYPYDAVYTVDAEHPVLRFDTAPAVRVRIDEKTAAHIRVQFSTAEPEKELAVSVSSEIKNRLCGSYCLFSAPKEASRTTNILKRYQAAYQRLQKRER